MTTTPVVPESDPRDRWYGWASFTLERLPLPYPVICTLVGLMVLAEQVLEYSLDDPTFSNVTLRGVTHSLVVPALVVYILVALRILKDRTVEELVGLRPSVLISDEDYDAHVRRIVSYDRRTELALLVTSVAVVLTIFVVLRTRLPIAHSRLPADLPAAAFIMVNYVIFGWLGLTIVHTGIQHARALGSLAHCPLMISVFDPANLLPFGRLSLLYSLSFVGIILLLVIPLGRPTEVSDYLVLLLSSLASVLVLVFPLWGVHRQMVQAKERALARIYDQLAGVQGALFGETDLSEDNLGALARHTETLVNFRKMILAGANWPVRDTSAAVRAIILAMAPLIYQSFIEPIIRLFILRVLQGF
jgi:hypothetical protein